jgi:hypothetical protein
MENIPFQKVSIVFDKSINSICDNAVVSAIYILSKKYKFDSDDAMKYIEFKETNFYYNKACNQNKN